MMGEGRAHCELRRGRLLTRGERRTDMLERRRESVLLLVISMTVLSLRVAGLWMR